CRAARSHGITREQLEDVRGVVKDRGGFARDIDPDSPAPSDYQPPPPEKPTVKIEDERTLKLLDMLDSPAIRGAFHPLWSELKEDASRDALERLKMRFVRNAPVL